MKKVDNENIKINYQKNNNDIVLASYELINKDEKLVEILFIGFEDLKYFNIYKQFEDALEARELVKASVLNNADIPAKMVAEDIATEIGAEVVSVVGNKFVLYKESKKHKTI